MNKEIFKVGDRVFSIHYGWGEVTEKIYNDDEDDFYVAFKTKDKLVEVSYTKDGREYNVEQPTLSFTEYTLQGFSQERPVELPKVGELCLVRDCNDDTWLAREFAEYRNGLFICQAVHGQGEVEWKYMKRIKILD